MKALVYTGPQQLSYRDAEEPEPRAGEALVEVEAVGICGSDMHAFLGHDERRPPPLILGHEAAGIVRAGARSGRRVTINPLVTCRTCRQCRSGRANLCSSRQIISMPPRDGAFAEFVCIPEANIVEVPDGTSFEQAALAEPLACGWHAVRLAQSACHAGLDEARCLVFGGGAIGLGAALVLIAHGAGDVTVVEPHDGRRTGLARIAAVNAVAGTHDLQAGFDIIVDGVGLQATRRDASRLAAPGGVVVHIGLGSAEGGLDIRRMTLQEITFIGTYTYTPEDFQHTAQAIFDGRLGSLDWPEVRALSDGASAFADIRDGRVSAPKIVLRP